MESPAASWAGIVLGVCPQGKVWESAKALGWSGCGVSGGHLDVSEQREKRSQAGSGRGEGRAAPASPEGGKDLHFILSEMENHCRCAE